MDLAAIGAKQAEGREFEHEMDGCVFELRLPPADEAKLLMSYIRATETEPAVVGALYQRSVLERAIVGWRGVTTRHMLQKAPDDDPVLWSRRAVPMLMHAQPTWAVALGVLVLQRLDGRFTHLEAEEKNSAST